jgi:hypothetical protein
METLHQLAVPACYVSLRTWQLFPEMRPQPACQDWFAGKNAVEAILAVDKPLHIHRTRCAERRLLKTSRFFSTIGAGSIQSLSSSFGAT